MSEWKNIETAPRDGSEIQGNDGIEVFPCRWGSLFLKNIEGREVFGWVRKGALVDSEAHPMFWKRDDAAEIAHRLATLETAVLTIIKAVQSYLPPDSGVTEKDFISEVIGAVDNPAVFAALHGTSDAGNDSLKRAWERGK